MFFSHSLAQSQKSSSKLEERPKALPKLVLLGDLNLARLSLCFEQSLLYLKKVKNYG